MIQADTHLHTCYSHGAHTPWEMLVSAKNKGLKLIGFSEHSPRPLGFDYIHEYREQLTRFLPQYVTQILELKQKSNNCRVLLGLEMDWLEGQIDFIKRAITAYPYDYLTGSVHFLGDWGFDDGREPWLNASQEQCEALYEHYFHNWKNMLASGLFQIAAHPDLIKIFSVEQFHIWLAKPQARALIHDCLLTLRNSGMAMEISSAGLRKACAEIYPAPEIMEIASSLHLPVSFASDAHCMGDIGRDFDKLAAYAKSFGFERQTVFEQGRVFTFSI